MAIENKIILLTKAFIKISGLFLQFAIIVVNKEKVLLKFEAK